MNRSESVWDYPRPPRLEPSDEPMCVIVAGSVIAESTRAQRPLETSHPPSYYFPPDDVLVDLLQPSTLRSFCEFKGRAEYWHASIEGVRIENIAWSYPDPSPQYAALTNHFAFYASRADACWVGDERVVPQPDDFYGGWVTALIRGPFKGGPGTTGW